MKRPISIIAVLITAAVLFAMLMTACGKQDEGATPQSAFKTATQTAISDTSSGAGATDAQTSTDSNSSTSSDPGSADNSGGSAGSGGAGSGGAGSDSGSAGNAGGSDSDSGSAGNAGGSGAGDADEDDDPVSVPDQDNTDYLTFPTEEYELPFIPNH